MKKLLSFLLIICFCLCTVGCNKVTNINSSSLSSTITEIEIETIYVDEQEGSSNNTTTEESKVETTANENTMSSNESMIETIVFTNDNLNVSVGNTVIVGI